MTKLMGGIHDKAEVADVQALDETELRAIPYQTAEELDKYVSDKAEKAALNNGDLRKSLADSIIKETVEKFEAQKTTDLNGKPLSENDKSDWGQFMGELSAKLALLHTLGGSLFQGWAGISDMSKVMTMEERAQYQRRDIDWLLQIPFLTEHVKTGDSKKEQKDAAEELTRLTENYGILRQNATNLSSSHQALDAMLADSENGLVMQVSGNMLTGKGKLTPEEQSAINMLAGLGNRIAANPDVLKDKGLTLVVTDIITDTDDTDQSMTTVKITEDLI